MSRRTGLETGDTRNHDPRHFFLGDDPAQPLRHRAEEAVRLLDACPRLGPDVKTELARIHLGEDLGPELPGREEQRDARDDEVDR